MALHMQPKKLYDKNIIVPQLENILKTYDEDQKISPAGAESLARREEFQTVLEDLKKQDSVTSHSLLPLVMFYKQHAGVGRLARSVDTMLCKLFEIKDTAEHRHSKEYNQMGGLAQMQVDAAIFLRQQIEKRKAIDVEVDDIARESYGLELDELRIQLLRIQAKMQEIQQHSQTTVNLDEKFMPIVKSVDHSNNPAYQMLMVSREKVIGLIVFVERNVTEQTKGFYTLVLHETNALLAGKPHAAMHLKNLGHLINVAPGTPSAKRMLAGILLGIAGVALIGLSVFSAFATYGAATPISLLGIKFGASLISAAVAYTTGLALGAYGEYSFLKGMRHGASAKIRDVREDVVTRIKPGLS